MFRISDVHALPETREDRNDYADADDNVLSEKFQLQDPAKLRIGWESITDRLVALKQQQSRRFKNASNVCLRVINDPFYSKAWPEIVKLAKMYWLFRCLHLNRLHLKYITFEIYYI